MQEELTALQVVARIQWHRPGNQQLMLNCYQKFERHTLKQIYLISPRRVATLHVVNRGSFRIIVSYSRVSMPKLTIFYEMFSI